MSLRRVGKIRCYANPYNSHFQLLLPQSKSRPTVLRGFQLEASVQKKNSMYHRSDVCGVKISQIESLCKAFDLKSFKYISLFNSTRNKKENKESISTPVKDPQCKKCAKIRKFVKTFVRATFEEEKPDIGSSLADEPKRIRMRIFQDDAEQVAVSEPQAMTNATVCFGCDQPKRESSIRGPPIISPVCGGNVSPCPLGEVFKNAPERVKKIVKIDRPRSLGYRKRMVEREQPRETTVHETRKPYDR